MCNLIKKLFFFFIFFYIAQNHAIIVGSNTAVSVQSAASFPSSGNADNEMRGFAQFLSGFTLASSTTRCLFTSFFPINSQIDMRGGQLNLARDLILSQTASFLSTGTIAGNNFSMRFSADTNPFIFPITSTSSSLNLIATRNVGQVVNSADWTWDNLFVVAGTNGGALANNIFNSSFNGSTLTAAGATGSLATSPNALSARWHPSTYWLAVALNGLGLSLAQVQTYSFTPPTTFATGGASAVVLSPTGEAVAWNPAGTFLASGNSGGAATGNVQVYSFNATTGALGAAINYNNSALINQNNALSWSPDGTFIVAGSSGATQIYVLNFNGAALSLTASAAPGNTATAVAFSPLGGYIAVGLSGGTNNIRVYQFNGVTLTEIIAAQVGETKNVLSVDWSPDGSHVVYGLASGTGTELRTYKFNYITGTLTLDGAVDTGAASLNDVRWSNNSQYIATGDSANVVSVYNVALTLPFIFDKLKLILSSNLTSSASLLFNGACEIEGNGFTLDLSSTPSLTIGASANLLLKNITIKGIGGTNINFSDTTGVLRLQDVIWTQTGTYIFTDGAFTIDGSCLFTGTSNFIYSSSKTSTINSNATLMFDNGMTFSYAPSTNARNLINMIDQTSNLYFLNTSLYSTNTGLQLTKGSFYIDGPCTVVSTATVSAQGIIFGDGASAANNVTIKILPESGFNLNSGFLVYNNV